MVRIDFFTMSIKEKGDIINDHFDDTIAIELHK